MPKRFAYCDKYFVLIKRWSFLGILVKLYNHEHHKQGIFAKIWKVLLVYPYFLCKCLKSECLIGFSKTFKGVLKLTNNPFLPDWHLRAFSVNQGCLSFWGQNNYLAVVVSEGAKKKITELPFVTAHIHKKIPFEMEFYLPKEDGSGFLKMISLFPVWEKFKVFFLNDTEKVCRLPEGFFGWKDLQLQSDTDAARMQEHECDRKDYFSLIISLDVRRIVELSVDELEKKSQQLQRWFTELPACLAQIN